MNTPPVEEEKDPGVRLLARVFASIVFWCIAFAAAHLILSRDPESTAIRAGAVALALAGLLPWIWMASRAIAAQDEFSQRVHFLALSWSFAATGVFVVASDLLVRAHFLGYVPLMHIVMFMAIAWWVSITLVRRRYR